MSPFPSRQTAGVGRYSGGRTTLDSDDAGPAKHFVQPPPIELTTFRVTIVGGSGWTPVVIDNDEARCCNMDLLTITAIVS